MSNISENKKMFATPIDAKVSEDFKQQCKNLNISMNIIIETFMKDFNKGKFLLGMERDKESNEIVFAFKYKDE